MSAIQAAAALIDKLGSGSVDDILADMPGLTRTQVQRALKGAEDAGLIESDGRPPAKENRPHRATGQPHGAPPMVYRTIRKSPSARRPPSCVWSWAQMQVSA